MDIDLTASVPPLRPTVTEPGHRARFLARRLIGWLFDGALLGAVLTMVTLALTLLWTIVVGVAIGAAGGGLEGLAVGGAAGLLALVILVIASILLGVGALLGYFAWAARRSGDAAGQTLGHELAGVRVVRDGDVQRRVGGLRLLARELARYLWLAVTAVPALMVATITESAALGNLLLVATMGAVVWCSSAQRLPHDRMAGTRVVPASSS